MPSPFCKNSYKVLKSQGVTLEMCLPLYKGIKNHSFGKLTLKLTSGKQTTDYSNFMIPEKSKKKEIKMKSPDFLYIISFGGFRKMRGKISNTLYCV